jgi:hypothetical protein
MMSNLEEFLSVALLVPMGPDAEPSDPECIWGLPVVVEGPPGTGKSAVVKQVSKAVGLKCSVIYCPTRNPEDFAGALVLDPGSKYGVRTVCALTAVQQMMDLEKGVFNLDEISGTSRAVQNALLGFVLDRAVGDTQLPPSVRILSTANGVNEGGNYELIAPLANRFAWIRREFLTGREFGSYHVGGAKKLPPLVDGEEQVKRAWPATWAKTKGLMVAFINANEEALKGFPGEGDPARSHAWPSPRSIETMFRAIATCHILGKSHLQFDVAKACVGEGLATEWAAWSTDHDLPDPEEMLTKGWTPDRSRIDITVAAVSSIAAFIKGYPAGPKRNAYAVKAWEILAATVQAGMADLVVEPSRVLLEEGFLATGGDPAVKKAAAPVVTKALKLGLKATV